MSIENGTRSSIYPHEALHAAKDVYSKSPLRIWHCNKYGKKELTTKVESELLEEIVCGAYIFLSKRTVAEDMVKKYLPLYRKRTYSLTEYDPKEKKRIWRWLNYLKKLTGEVVNTTYCLKTFFESDILVPLFFSLGPTWQEISSERFESPFMDVINLLGNLDDRTISKNEIEEAIRKKGYGK